MNRLRSILAYLAAAALGVATLAALADGWLPPGLVAGAFAVGFILLLPHRPRLVAAYCGGAAAALLATWALWSLEPGWGCASEVDGVIVEHDCAEPPPRQAGTPTTG